MLWSCEHDWQPSAKSYAAPAYGVEMNGRGSNSLAVVQRLQLGYTTLIYQCAKCKTLRREECLGQGDFVEKSK